MVLMSGNGNLSHTTGCVLVLTGVWGRLVVLVMRLGAFGIWMNVAWQQTLLGKSCHPLQTPSRESRALGRWQWGAGRGLSSPQEQHTALLCTLAGRLSQQQVYQHNLKGFNRKPNTQTGTGLGVQREK